MDEFFRKRIGYVISNTIELEKQFDDFLSKHFCYQPNRQEDFKSLVLYNERMTLDFKRELFTIIIKSEYKALLDAHPTVLNDLSRLPEHRNRFAHLQRVVGDEFEKAKDNKIQVWSGIHGDKTISTITEQTIVFKRYKNGSVKYLGYGEEEVDEMADQLSNIVYFLMDVYKVMSERLLNMENERNKIRVEVLTELKERILHGEHKPELGEL